MSEGLRIDYKQVINSYAIEEDKSLSKILTIYATSRRSASSSTHCPFILEW